VTYLLSAVLQDEDDVHGEDDAYQGEEQDMATSDLTGSDVTLKSTQDSGMRVWRKVRKG
jgi:hypothetical protein